MKTRKFDIDSDEYPFESQWFERNGSTMHYVDEGEGIPVVMCHGNPTWSFLYRKVIKLMSGKCRCIAYDLPGFGFSEHPAGYTYTPKEHAEWIEALLVDHLKLDKFIMVVQDWGGPTGLRVATRHPQRVAGLLISNTWAWESNEPVFKVFSRVMGHRFMQRQTRKYNLFAGLIMRKMLASEFATPHVLEAYTAPFPTPASRMGTSVFPQEILASNPWLDKLEGDLGKLKDIPVEFIFGGKDLISSNNNIQRWLQHFPEAKVQMVANANHFTQEECPQCYETALKRLLTVTNSRSG